MFQGKFRGFSPRLGGDDDSEEEEDEKKEKTKPVEKLSDGKQQKAGNPRDAEGCHGEPEMGCQRAEWKGSTIFLLQFFLG